MMLPLLFLSLSQAVDAPTLSALSEAVSRCDRGAVTPVFTGEEERRSRFLIDAYGEQEAIITARAALNLRRQSLRAGPVANDTEELARSEAEALSDRQQALNDARQLERLRQEATDQLRRQFLASCGESSRRSSGGGAHPSGNGA